MFIWAIFIGRVVIGGHPFIVAVVLCCRWSVFGLLGDLGVGPLHRLVDGTCFGREC